MNEIISKIQDVIMTLEFEHNKMMECIPDKHKSTLKKSSKEYLEHITHLKQQIDMKDIEIEKLKKNSESLSTSNAKLRTQLLEFKTDSSRGTHNSSNWSFMKPVNWLWGSTDKEKVDASADEDSDEDLDEEGYTKRERELITKLEENNQKTIQELESKNVIDVLSMSLKELKECDKFFQDNGAGKKPRYSKLGVMKELSSSYTVKDIIGVYLNSLKDEELNLLRCLYGIEKHNRPTIINILFCIRAIIDSAVQNKPGCWPQLQRFCEEHTLVPLYKKDYHHIALWFQLNFHNNDDLKAELFQTFEPLLKK